MLIINNVKCKPYIIKHKPYIAEHKLHTIKYKPNSLDKGLSGC